MTLARQLHRGGAVGWAILLAFAFVGTVALIVLGPWLVLAGLALLVLAWRLPHRTAPYLEHRWLARVPQWMRASPMRFASVVLALTLPFGGASYALNQPAAPSVTPVGEALADATEAESASPETPSAAPTPRPTPEPRATPGQRRGRRVLRRPRPSRRRPLEARLPSTSSTSGRGARC